MQVSLDAQRFYGIIAISALATAVLAFFTGPVTRFLPRFGVNKDLVVTVWLVVLIASTIVACVSIARWHRIRRVKRFGMRPSWHWRFAFPSANAQPQRALAQTLDVESLLGAYHLPDHTEAARKVLIEELQSRGHSVDQIESWRPSADRLTVPSALKPPMTSVKYAQLVRFRSAMFLVCQFFAFSLFLPLLLAPVYALLFTIASIGGRNRCVRILLLRPFQQGRLTRPLKKMVLKNLGKHGHVFTLADDYYKTPIFFVIVQLLRKIGAATPILYGPMTRFSPRAGRVKNEQTFFKLAVWLSSRMKPSFLSAASGGQAFNIKSTDAWWKNCIDLLMHSSDIIVMDISRIGAGSAWEIEQLVTRDMLSKCVFMIQEGHVEPSLEKMKEILLLSAVPRPFVFREDGTFVNQVELYAAFQDRLEKALTDKSPMRHGTLRGASVSSAKVIDITPIPLKIGPERQQRPEKQGYSARSVEAARPSARLIPAVGRRPIEIPLEQVPGSVVIGRGPDCDILLDDPSISRRHCRLDFEATGEIRVHDLGSGNGIRINGMQLSRGTVGGGDLISLGSLEFRLELYSSAADARGALPAKNRAAARQLVAVDEQGNVTRFFVDVASNRTWVIGRSEHADLVIPSRTVSAKHAVLRSSSDGRLEIHDLGSSNGTIVNGRRIGREWTAIEPSSQLWLGGCEIKVTRAVHRCR